MRAAPDALLLDERAPVRGVRTEDRVDDPWHRARGRRLLCARCGAAITAAGWARELGGSHEHSFVNPHGYLYRIGCFVEAPGCAPHGDEVAEYTWFPGYSWQIAQCAGCAAHLGWGFRGRDDGFHGLILDRLVPENPGAEGDA